MGCVAKGIVMLLPQWGISVLWVVFSFPLFQTILGKEKDPIMIHQHMEVRENCICVGNNSFDLNGLNLPKLKHLPCNSPAKQ